MKKMLLAFLLAACLLVVLGCADHASPEQPMPRDPGGDADLKAKAASKEADIAIAKAEKLLQPVRIQKRTDKICRANPSWTEDVCLKLAEGKLWVGMDISMVHESIGLPDHINRTHLSDGGGSIQLVYKSPQYYIYVTQGGIVTEFQTSR
jgi:hypothetical protein